MKMPTEATDGNGMIHLIVVAGFAGVGKSTLARALARRLKYAYYDKDTLTEPLTAELLAALGSPLGRDDRETALYASRVRPLEYQCLRDTAMESLSLGISTIVTAPFLREVNDPLWREALEKDCQDATPGSVRCLCVWVHSADAAVRQRLARRGCVRDAGNLADWDGYLARCAAIPAPLAPVLEVDNSSDDDIEGTVDRIVESLGFGAC